MLLSLITAHLHLVTMMTKAMTFKLDSQVVIALLKINNSTIMTTMRMNKFIQILVNGCTILRYGSMKSTQLNQVDR